MYEQKTKPTVVSVKKFLDSIEDAKRKTDAYTVLKIMEAITKEAPVMWGATMVGFGSYHYKYASGHEGDCYITGLSPRKNYLVLYIMPGFDDYETLMKKLGKYKTGKSCLYIKDLNDIDISVLEKLIESSVEFMKATYK